MNKSELVDRVARTTQMSKSDIESTLNSVIQAIKSSVQRGDDVTLSGFGTFTSVVLKKRNGRDPRTGEPIVIPEQKTPRFRAGKDFKELVQVSQNR